MLLSGETLFVAGPPEHFVRPSKKIADAYHINSTEALDRQEAALAGKDGGLLLAVSTSDGGKLAELELPGLPAWDSLVAARGRPYLTMADGKVLCFKGAD